MTGLLNDQGFRPILESALGAACQGRRRCALLSIDLDGFWRVNDTWGPEAGDEVLRAVAHRLFASVRATDSVSRTNRKGDEFAVLADEIGDVEVARALAERLRRALSEPIRLRSSGRPATIEIGGSVGVVLLAGECGLTAAEVLALGAARREDAKVNGLGVVSEGDGPDDEAIRRHNDEKGAIRSGGLAAGPRLGAEVRPSRRGVRTRRR